MGLGAALFAAALVTPALSTAASAGLLSSSPYIVATPGTVGTLLAQTDVLSVAGQIVQALPAANGVEANLNSLEVAALSALPGIVVTPDVAVSVQSLPVGSTHPPSDMFLKQTGADGVQSQGDTGAGVNVAVLDTGIDPLPDFAGRLVGGVDLSGEGNAFQDSYGHGTFDAGLIAGNGASSNGKYAGEAPGAGLVSVKVAGASGSTDLATVIAGVGWTINNHTALHIGVLNMSLGYQPLESSAVDPLDTAVEAAWQSGMVVVVSSGNAGPFNGTVESPGDDPLVITVGALDDGGQGNPNNDTMTEFSGVGPTNPDGWLKPDLVTSGRSVVSVAAPGSAIYNTYPGARIGSGNFVGSGTSFSAAITSGAAALVLSADSGYAPNTVKGVLLDSTMPGPVGNPVVDGHGDLNVANALALAPVTVSQAPSLLAVPLGATVALSSTWNLSSWNPTNWSGPGWTGVSWNGVSWNGVSWNGESWNGESWNGESWNGVSWNGVSWNGVSWNGVSWNGESWNGESWNGVSWNGVSWNGSAWN